MERILTLLVLSLLGLGLACTTQNNSYKSSVELALQRAHLKDVSVSEDVEMYTPRVVVMVVVLV